MTLPALAAAAAALAALLVLERLHPLRRTVHPVATRWLHNASLGALSAALVFALQPLVLHPVAEWAQRSRFGLLHLLPAPRWLEVAAAVLLLDYTLWHWHRWNHRVAWLWRFHAVHHADRDLDASTGARFHFGEMALSVPYRAAQVALIGADAAAVALWTALLLASIAFHHSNLRLPLRLEAVLVRLLVTPRMHGIHHSQRRDQLDTNFASLLSAWDYLHRTIRLDVPQQEIAIGVPALDTPAPLPLVRALALPFRRQPDYWPGQPRPALPSGPAVARLAP